MTKRLRNLCVREWVRKSRKDTKVTGTTSDIYNVSWSRRTEAFISSSVVPQINRCREWKWQKKKISSDGIWKVPYLSPKQEHKQAHPHSFNERKWIHSPSHLHRLTCTRSKYAIEETDGISYQQSFHVAALLYLHVAVCSVWYLFHHLAGSIRKHISHSKWHQKQFKTKAGSVGRIIMCRTQQATNKNEAWRKTGGHCFFLYCRCAKEKSKLLWSISKPPKKKKKRKRQQQNKNYGILF